MSAPPLSPRNVDEVVSIARMGAMWAVTKRGGFLGQVRSASEAEQIPRDLVTWLGDQGRAAVLRMDEPCSFCRDCSR